MTRFARESHSRDQFGTPPLQALGAKVGPQSNNKLVSCLLESGRHDTQLVIVRAPSRMRGAALHFVLAEEGSASRGPLDLVRALALRKARGGKRQAHSSKGAKLAGRGF